MRAEKRSHISYEERVRIEVWIGEGWSNNKIGKRLNKSPSTITREINLNKAGPQRSHYRAKTAHDLAKCRKRRAAQSNPQKGDDVWEYVEEKIKKGWSPEIISGRLKIDNPHLSVSHEAIYQYVYRQGFELASYLPWRRPLRRPKGPRKAKQSSIPNRFSILQRPEEVNRRDEIGHWESDSIVSRKSKESLNVMVERLSRLAQISKISDMKPVTTQTAIVSRLKDFKESLRRSLTYDNGFENRNHQIINEKLGTKSYFCQPYHSWEKGSVEQVNMLIRRYIPKKTDLSKVTDKQINLIESQLNNRPRKCLGYKTPWEVFNSFR